MSQVPIPDDLLWALRDHGIGHLGSPNADDLKALYKHYTNRAERKLAQADALQRACDKHRGTTQWHGLYTWWAEALGEIDGLRYAHAALSTTIRRACDRDRALHERTQAWVDSEPFQRAVSDDLFTQAFEVGA